MIVDKFKGIDISKWQGSIDFNKVANDGIRFVILRSSFRHSVDQKFFDYVEGCKNANIPIFGVYHFSYALSVSQAVSEARFCMEQIEKAGLDKNTVIFFDFEYDTVKKAKESGVILTRVDCNSHAKAFCETIEKAGYTPGIYTNLDYYRNWYDKSIFDKYILWLADYSGDPDYDCTVHQYSSTGKVDGISGNVDLDYLYDYRGEKIQNGSDSSEKRFDRQKIIDLARSWIGKKESDGSFKDIIDVYNTHLPHTRA